MEPSADAAVVWLRAVLVAVVTVFLGVGGHVTADGLLPGPMVILPLLTLTIGVCALSLNGPATALRLVVLLVGGQTLVHLVLTVTAGHVGDPAGSAMHPATTGLGSLPAVDGHRVGSLQDAYDGAAGPAEMAPALPIGHLIDDLSSHAPMMAVHLLAAALVGLWLAVGERCLWALLALAARFVVAPFVLIGAVLRSGIPTLPRLIQRSADPPGLRCPDLLARSVVRRGPPRSARLLAA